MTSLAFVLLSGTLTFGVPMLLGARELFTLGRGQGNGGDEPPREPTFTPAPKPLPTCLLPPPMPVLKTVRGQTKVPTLEDA